MSEHISPESIEPTERVEKLVVNINGFTANAIKTLMAVEGESATEIVRRAIGTYSQLREQELLGSKLLLEKSDGNTTQLLFPK